MDADIVSRVRQLNYDYCSKSNESVYECNLCRNEVFVTLEHYDRYGYQAQSCFCINCGLTFLNPRMTRDEYAGFYQSTYRPLVSAYHGRLINAQTVQEDQKIYTKSLLRIIEPFLNKRKLKTLLDIGGSTGIVAAGLSKKFGLKATIIDPAPDEINEAKLLGIQSITGFVEDWNPGDQKFDIIGLFQTIDHLLDIKSTLNKIRQVISKNGLFVFDIVDFRNAFLKYWDISSAIKIDHPYYITDFVAEEFIKITGFQLLRKVISEDKLHILYICEASQNQSSLLKIDARRTEHFYNEIRFVQSTAWKKK